MSGSKPPRSLHLPMASRPDSKLVRHRRPTRLRWTSLLVALGLEVLGVGLLFGLLLLSERLDTVLLLSQALANLIGGVQRVLLGLVPMVALVLFVGVAVAALVLVVAGVVRFVRALAPLRRRRSRRNWSAGSR